MTVQFKLTVPLAKSDREDGWFITGVAAGTDVDSEGDRITPNAIAKMAEQINTSPVPFKDWHATNTILSDMGEVCKAWLTDDNALGVEVQLDQKHPAAQYLWGKLDDGKQYGMSIQGDAGKYWYSTEKSANGRAVREIDEVLLNEISATTKPIYTPSFGTVLRKAIDEAEAKSVPTGDKSSVDETPVTTGESTAAPETTEQVAAAPANAPEVVAEVAKAVSADTARDAKGLAKLVKFHNEMGTLLTELGIDVTASDPAPAAAPSTDNTAEVAKSTDEELLSLVRSQSEVIALLKADLETVKERIPETTGPGVAVRKSESEEALEEWNRIRSEDPARALRLALDARHQGERR
jgi:hypothetical protein